VNVVVTENTAMVANLGIAAAAYVRRPPVVEVAPYGGGTTEFIQNQALYFHTTSWISFASRKPSL
jgi:hypothetical protein